jgi:dCTP diphosphatase
MIMHDEAAAAGGPEASTRAAVPADRPDRYTAFLQRLRAFMAEREWKQFHNPKDLAIALSIEASELLELFLWKNGDEIPSQVNARGEDIRDEVADVGIYLLQISDALGIDLFDAMASKMEKNARKYPVARAKGSSRKYTELQEE